MGTWDKRDTSKIWKYGLFIKMHKSKTIKQTKQEYKDLLTAWRLKQKWVQGRKARGGESEWVCEWERKIVCVCVCVSEWERGKRERVCEREKVWEKETEREREKDR